MTPRRMAGTLAAVLLAVAAGWLLWSADWTPDPLEVGEAAPAFELPRLDGGAPVSLEAQRGRVVLVNFWATWCKPCEDEMPAMQRLYQRLGGDDFELLAVSVDTGREEVEAFRDRLDLSFPILLDPAKHVSTRYQSFKYPESWLVDREGRLVARFVGPREWDAPAYMRRIERLLGREAAPPAGPDGAPPGGAAGAGS